MEKHQKIILHVDDDPDDGLLLRQALELVSPVTFQQAFNGIEARAILEKDKLANQLPNLIVLDINMPSMDGVATLQAIKRDSKLIAIPIVIFTTGITEGDLAFFKLFKTEAIIKPSHWDSYKDVAKRLLTYCK
jgi:CheY-like chemotaxis protein